LQARGIAQPGIQDVANAVIEIRQSKLPDPKEIGNSGSFFKNPEIPEDQYQELAIQYPTMPHYPTLPGQVKIPAGWLIEQCGWKGKKMGPHQNYGVHEKQALVLVNYGGATGEQIWDLAIAIQADVFQKFGITIQPEVNLIKA
jgi:UDP-N-acetylmuramate dehydrogenase